MDTSTMASQEDNAKQRSDAAGQPRTRSRKRACMACRRCHERKVRCDLCLRGKCCTNCQLDGSSCVPRSRASRRQNPAFQKQSLDKDRRVKRYTIDPSPAHPATAKFWNQLTELGDMARSITGTPSWNQFIPLEHVLVRSALYEFSRPECLDNLPSDDVDFLDKKGCFELPSRPLLQHFMRKYFLHIHPSLPIVDETRFRVIFGSGTHVVPKAQKLSLFVLQAMLCASCSFCPVSLAQELGFDDLRSARDFFYQKAKLLYDLDYEDDIQSKIQGCAILTFYSVSGRLHAGRPWLTSAIGLAVASGAHTYAVTPDIREMRIQKRLWWCLVLRDRAMALATRRPLQIQIHVFDPRNDSLDEADVEDEVHTSEVYTAGVKKLLAGVLNLQCSLASTLSDLIMFVYSPRLMSHSLSNAGDSMEQTIRKLKRVESDTKAWFERVTNFLSSVPTACDSYDNCVFQLEVCQLYHWAGQIALQQYKILLLEARPEYARAGETFRKEALQEKLADSVMALNRSVRAYALRGSECSLPTEVMLCCAQPLLLYALDCQLAVRGHQKGSSTSPMHILESLKLCGRSSSSTIDLSYFILEAVKRARPLLEGLADRLGEPAMWTWTQPGYPSSTESDQSANMGPTQTSFDAKPGQMVEAAQAKSVEDWQSLLARHPRVFLHVIFSLEMAIQRGHFPKLTDLPLAICQPRSASISSPPHSQVSSFPVNLGLTIPYSQGISEAFTADESTGIFTPSDQRDVSDTNQTPLLPDLQANMNFDFVDLEGPDAMDFRKALSPASEFGWPLGMNSGLEETFLLA